MRKSINYLKVNILQMSEVLRKKKYLRMVLFHVFLSKISQSGAKEIHFWHCHNLYIWSPRNEAAAMFVWNKLQELYTALPSRLGIVSLAAVLSFPLWCLFETRINWKLEQMSEEALNKFHTLVNLRSECRDFLNASFLQSLRTFLISPKVLFRFLQEEIS